MEGWKNGRMVGRKDGNIGHDGMALLGFRTILYVQNTYARDLRPRSTAGYGIRMRSNFNAKLYARALC